MTIVNAISIGKGAALAIDLRTEATVEVRHGGEELTLDAYDRYGRLDQDKEGALVLEVLREIKRRLDVSDVGFKVEVKSEIPAARGLKSSSSAAVAVALASLKAFGAWLTEEEVLNVVATASIRSGTSITGAMDDAAACMLGGIVVTDNVNRKIITRDAVPDGLKVVALVPKAKSYTGAFERGRLDCIKDLVEVSFELALKRDYWRAATLNGLLHASAIGLSTEPIIRALRSNAIAAGISGKGPAVFAVCDESNVDDIVSLLSCYEGEVISCSAVNYSAYREACSSR